MRMVLPFVSPSTEETLVLSSFLVVLQVASVISHKVLKVGMIGFIVVGVVYGVTNLLPLYWQETFMSIGHLGLILLVFEGALETDIKLVTRNLSLSTVCAVTGVVFPIGLSMLLLIPAFGFTTIQAFAAGASLSATSLGTTVSVLKAGSTSPQSTWFSASITTVLMSAATIDDVLGLVMASVMPSLGMPDSSTVGWAIGRPILASVGLAIVTFLSSKLINVVYSTKMRTMQAPERSRNRIMFLCIVVSLTAFTAAAAYAGTSILFGSFASGILFSYIDMLSADASHHRTGTGDVDQRPQPSDFRATFHKTIGPVQESIFAPLFFASIGFAIPFGDLWQTANAGHGIAYAALMILGKLLVGVWIPIWSFFWPRDKATNASAEAELAPAQQTNAPRDAMKAGVLLGSGMVARGEIGLLIIQLGYDGGRGPIPYDLYIVSIWALVLNTIVGPVLVAVTLKRWRASILKGNWGISHHNEVDSRDQELSNVRPIG